MEAAKALAPDITTFTDSMQMLDSGLIDLVVISTPPNSHYSWAKESLNRGLHVILEKPMALTVEQCDELIALARSFWPGPMTLILKRSALAMDFITGGQETVGLRVPNNVIALGLLNEFKKIGGKGVAAPSANRFGHVSPTTANAVGYELLRYLDKADLILHGGPSLVGIESTIIDCTTDRPGILRPGAITEEMIEEVTKLDLSYDATDLRVSGSLDNHYAPSAQVLLDIEPQPGDGFIALSHFDTPEGVIRLASPKTNEELHARYTPHFAQQILRN